MAAEGARGRDFTAPRRGAARTWRSGSQARSDVLLRPRQPWHASCVSNSAPNGAGARRRSELEQGPTRCPSGKRRGRMSGDVRPLFLSTVCRLAAAADPVGPKKRSAAHGLRGFCADPPRRSAAVRWPPSLLPRPPAYPCPDTRKPRGAGLSVRAPTPDGDGTGGIRDSASDVDIEATPQLRRIATQSVNTRVSPSCRTPVTARPRAGDRRRRCAPAA